MAICLVDVNSDTLNVSINKTDFFNERNEVLLYITGNDTVQITLLEDKLKEIADAINAYLDNKKSPLEGAEKNMSTTIIQNEEAKSNVA